MAEKKQATKKAEKKQATAVKKEVTEIKKEIKATGTIDKAVFVKFLDDIEEGLAHYAGRRTERLRREFVTDLTELITKTRENLK